MGGGLRERLFTMGRLIVGNLEGNSRRPPSPTWQQRSPSDRSEGQLAGAGWLRQSTQSLAAPRPGWCLLLLREGARAHACSDCLGLLPRRHASLPPLSLFSPLPPPLPSSAAIKRSSLDQAVVAAAPRVGQPAFPTRNAPPDRTAQCAPCTVHAGGTPRLVRPPALCTYLGTPSARCFHGRPCGPEPLCAPPRVAHFIPFVPTPPTPFQQARGGSGTHPARVFQSINEPAARDQSLSPSTCPWFRCFTRTLLHRSRRHTPSAATPPVSSYWPPFLSPCTSRPLSAFRQCAARPSGMSGPFQMRARGNLDFSALPPIWLDAAGRLTFAVALQAAPIFAAHPHWERPVLLAPASGCLRARPSLAS